MSYAIQANPRLAWREIVFMTILFVWALYMLFVEGIWPASSACSGGSAVSGSPSKDGFRAAIRPQLGPLLLARMPTVPPLRDVGEK